MSTTVGHLCIKDATPGEKYKNGFGNTIIVIKDRMQGQFVYGVVEQGGRFITSPNHLVKK